MTEQQGKERFLQVKDRLRVRLFDLCSKEEQEDAAYRPVGCGYAMAAWLSDADDPQKAGLVCIPGSGKAREEAVRLVLQTALENSVREAPAQLRRLREVLRHVLEVQDAGAASPHGTETEDDTAEGGAAEEGPAELYVLSGRTPQFGAAALFYPDTAAWIAQKVGGDYYVLPSSVHEVLILPDDGRQDAAELAVLVREINREMVSPAERLGDRVLFYSMARQTLEVAAALDGQADEPTA